MKKLCQLVVGILFVVTFGLFAADPSLEISRSFSCETYEKGGTVDVTVTVSSYGGFVMSNCTIHEHVPTGWTIDPESFKRLNHKTGKYVSLVKEALEINEDNFAIAYKSGWASTYDPDTEETTYNYDVPYTFKYSLNVPEDAQGDYSWSGHLLAWALDQDFGDTGKKFTISGAVSLGDGVVPEPELFDVTYYLNDGSDYKVVKNEIAAGEYILLSPADVEFERENYDFLGWGFSQDATEYKQSGDTIVIDGDTSLYAIWQQKAPQKVLVTYQGNGGLMNGENSYEVEVEVGTDYVVQENQFVRKYYAFSSWSLGGEEVFPGHVVKAIAEPLTLTANWTQKTVTISYNPGDGATINGKPLHTEQALAGDNYKVLSTEAVKENAEFIGWMYNGVVVEELKLEENDITLEAKWQEEQAKASIVYHVSSMYGDFGLYWDATPQVLEYESGTITVSENLWFKSCGYGFAFAGWARTDNAQAADFLPGDTIELEAGQEIDLYAVVKMCPELFFCALINTDGYLSGFDYENYTAIEGSDLYNSYYGTGAQVVLSHNQNGLDEDGIQSGRDTYVWFRVGNIGGAASESFKVRVNVDGTYYNGGMARWYDNELNNLDLPLIDGTISHETGLRIEAGYWYDSWVIRVDIGKLTAGKHSIAVELDYEKSNDEAVCWPNNEETAEGGVLNNVYEMEVSVAEGPAPTYNVVYHRNAGSFGIDDPSGPDETYPKSEQTEVLVPYDVDTHFGYLGWKFVEWNTKADGSGDSYVGGEKLESDMDLYAVWQGLPQLWFYPWDDKVSVHDWQYVLLSTDAENVGDQEKLYENEDFFVSFRIGNWFTGTAGDFEVGLEIYSADNPDELIVSKEVSCHSMLGEGPTQVKKSCAQFSLPAGQYRLVCTTDVNDKVVESYEGDEYENFVPVVDENGEDVFISGYKVYVLNFTVERKAHLLTVDGGEGDGEYTAGTEIEIQATVPEGKVFHHWEASAGIIADANAENTVFTMPDQAVTVRAVFVAIGEHITWPEDSSLYTPAHGKVFKAAADLSITFSWPNIVNAEGYVLTVKTYGGDVVYVDETLENSVTVTGADVDSYVWTVTAKVDGASMTSSEFTFAVIDGSTLPVIREVVGGGENLEITLEETVSSKVKCQLMFYSFAAAKWESKEVELSFENGKAVIDMDIDTAEGYLYIRSLQDGNDAKFIECYVTE